MNATSTPAQIQLARRLRSGSPRVLPSATWNFTIMLEHAANAAHECAEGHALPWFACIDQCKDFGPYLLVLVVLLLLSTAIEFVFRKLDDLGATPSISPSRMSTESLKLANPKL